MSDCPWILVATHVLAFAAGAGLGILAVCLGIAAGREAPDVTGGGSDGR